MITEIFESHYTTDMHPARLNPMTKAELSKGLSSDAVDKYLSYVEQLYNSLYVDVNKEFVPMSKEERHKKDFERKQLYNSLLKLLFKEEAISDDAYCELHKGTPVEFNYIEHPSIPNAFVSDSLDDFRLTLEYEIASSSPYTDLADSYFEDRYGYYVCVRPGTPSEIVSSKDLQVIRFEGISPNTHSVEASYWEVRHLLKSIKHDIKQNEADQKLLDEIICPGKNTSYANSIKKTIYGRPKNIAEWYTMKRALETESGQLWYAEDRIKRIFDTIEKPTDGVGYGATLFIYKGNILCHKYKHPLVPATAIIYDDQDHEIELNVEYCPNCKRYMLNYTSYEMYREKHGLMIAKLKMISGNGSGGEFEMAAESPLKLCGYSVSQADGLSASSRQYLLARIVHDGIMSKIDVIHYLEHFINMNGAKADNAIAVEKWCEDLSFIHKYNKSVQPKVYIGSIKKY